MERRPGLILLDQARCGECDRDGQFLGHKRSPANPAGCQNRGCRPNLFRLADFLHHAVGRNSLAYSWNSATPRLPQSLHISWHSDPNEDAEVKFVAGHSLEVRCGSQHWDTAPGLDDSAAPYVADNQPSHRFDDARCRHQFTRVAYRGETLKFIAKRNSRMAGWVTENHPELEVRHSD